MTERRGMQGKSSDEKLQERRGKNGNTMKAWQAFQALSIATDDLKMKAAGYDKCWCWYHVKCTPKYVQDTLDDEISLEDIYFECDYC